jgi:hypothetical protein
MNAEEFLDLAVKLSGRPTEAERRTAVSRAYYGAFHVALALVSDKCGVTLPIDEAHKKICFCLKGSKHALAEAAGRQLDSLRTARRIADYELTNPQPANARWASIQIGLMQQAVDNLAACSRPSAVDEVAAGVRRYARDVLRLIVRDSG